MSVYYRPEVLLRDLTESIARLIEVGLSVDQNFPYIRDVDADIVDVTFPGAHDIVQALKDRDYAGLHAEMSNNRTFTMKLPDGPLIQIWYRFKSGVLDRHRLAFFPSPVLSEFQNNPDIYLDEVAFAEVMSASVVPFPLRFDYGQQAETVQRLHHPHSHLTLGQYGNCRVPVSSPVAPLQFLDFVVRNFYHTAFLTYADKLTLGSQGFAQCIQPRDRQVIHIQVPDAVVL